MPSELEKRVLKRKKRKRRKKATKIAIGVTAAALTCNLMSNHCYKKTNKFYFHQDIKGNMQVDKNVYIGHEYIKNYYVIELYHTGLDRSMIYIANRFNYTSGDSKYTNVFNDYFIAYEFDIKDYYEFINVTPLSKYLEEYDMVKDKYSYNDMLYIRDLIKCNYIYGDVSQYRDEESKNKKLIKNNNHNSYIN